ncbi:MAG: LysR family transcriptional regulator [Pigmentiphaga sp.]
MEIKQLRALEAIADTGSFGEAAHQLGLTQSALSHQIRRLEEELDETLLIRARPKVYASPAGLEVLRSAQRIFGELMVLESRFAKDRAGPATGTLRVAATTMSITYVLGDICEAFMDRYPGIELIFTATETADLAFKRVLTGAADVAFGPLFESHPQLTALAIGQTEHAFIVRQDHPLANQETVCHDDLLQYPIALFQPGSGTRLITDGLFGEGAAYPQILTESNDAQFLKRIVSITSATALVAVYALSDELSRERLHLLRYRDRPLLVDVGIVHKSSLLMNTLELFKALCFEIRGPRPVEMLIENAHLSRPLHARHRSRQL